MRTAILSAGKTTTVVEVGELVIAQVCLAEITFVFVVVVVVFVSVVPISSV